MAAALGVVTIRRRRQSSRGEEPGLREDEVEDEPSGRRGRRDGAERKDLVAAIASLDDSYEQGRIGSEEYGMLRAQQKARLMEIVAKQRELADTRGDE